jgi:transposase
MKHHNTIGVDLAKHVIQVSVLSPQGKQLQNKTLSRKKFREFILQHKPSLVAFEACATAHYWSRFCQAQGHKTRILPVLSVLPFRQGHKTDRNDALAVAEAARRPQVKEAPYKTVDQQALQAIQRSRELLVGNRTALSNHIRGILMEFGFVIPQGHSALHTRIPQILEDGDNDLPDSYRTTLSRLYHRLCELRTDIQDMDREIATWVKDTPACEKLTRLEGVGPIGALLLYVTLGTGEAFANGREYAAYLGLTPKQYSSGGKTHLVGISRYTANKRLRAVLIQGARAYIHRASIGNSTKDQWLKALIERAGHGKAAVALANKNVRTAWALLTQGTEYLKTDRYVEAAGV